MFHTYWAKPEDCNNSAYTLCHHSTRQGLVVYADDKFHKCSWHFTIFDCLAT